MSIIHYPGYISKEEAAKRQQVQVRTINIQIGKKIIGSITIDGLTFVKDETPSSSATPAINLHSLQWVYRFSRRHKLMSDLVYEQIVLGKVTGVVVADRVFVIPDEPAVLSFLAERRKKQ